MVLPEACFSGGVLQLSIPPLIRKLESITNLTDAEQKGLGLARALLVEVIRTRGRTWNSGYSDLVHGRRCKGDQSSIR